MPVENAMKLLCNTGSRVAVVGASADRSKYGNTIFRWFMDRGYRVYPVNCRGGVIEGVVASLCPVDLPEPVDLLVFVTPPGASLSVLESMNQSQVPCIWFQPGSYDEAVLELARTRSPEVISGACVMMTGNRC